MSELLQKLKTVPLLHDFSLEVLAEEVAPFITEQKLANGENLYCQGDAPENFYILTAGELEILQENGDRARRINFLYPGEFCGDTALLYEESQPVTVRSSGASEVLVLQGAAFLDLYSMHKPFQSRLVRLGRVMEERANLTFAGQADDEIVIFFERRHWLALAQAMGGPITFVVIWFMGMGLAAWALHNQPEAQTDVVIIGIALLLIPILWTLWTIFDWMNDYYIVTNRRVIHIEQIYGIKKERYEAPMSKIQNVNLAQTTPIAELLGYGKLIITTAATGGQGSIILNPIPNPDLISQRIVHEQNRAQSLLAAEQHGEKRRALRSALGLEPAEEAVVPVAPPPPAPVSPQPVVGMLQRLFIYLRPTTREVRGKLIVWRRHPLWLLLHSVPAYLLLVLILLTGVAIQWAAPPPPPMSTILWVVMGVLLFLNFLWILWIYDDWRNDLYILTPDAILDEEKQPLGFNKQVRRAQIDMIQDVQYKQNNPVFVWLGIGHLKIQTAGQDGDFTFDWVHDPHSVQMDIFDAIHRRQIEKQNKDAATINREALDLLKLYDETRREQRDIEARQRAAAEAPTRAHFPGSEEPTREHNPDGDAPTRPSPPAP